jgi:hypothetical protein
MKSMQATYEELKPDADDLLVFVDDTGHETFAGNQGFYGLGACVVLGAHYAYLKARWGEVRHIVAGSPDAPLHACTIERKPENFEALSAFFFDPSFFRIAVTTTKDIGLPPHMHPASLSWVSFGKRSRPLLPSSPASEYGFSSKVRSAPIQSSATVSTSSPR